MKFFPPLSLSTNNVRSLAILVLSLAMLLLGGCASTPESESMADEVEATEIDPYEGFNRKMYAFNDSVDDYVAAPIANAYIAVTPDIIQTGVSNFFTNLSNVSVVLNDVLQGKVKQGAEDTGRFLINSTVGVFGLFDVASRIGLEQNQEDFGQTLAVWGVPTGSYLVMPFLGPTTFRGMPGAAVDIATNPITYVGIPAIHAASLVNTRANAEGAIQFIDDAALDPYIYTREAYLQWRNHLATDGDPDAVEDPLEGYEDELFEDDELYEETGGKEQALANDTDSEGVDSDQKDKVDDESAQLKSEVDTIAEETVKAKESTGELTIEDKDSNDSLLIIETNQPLVDDTQDEPLIN